MRGGGGWDLRGCKQVAALGGAGCVAGVTPPPLHAPGRRRPRSPGAWPTARCSAPLVRINISALHSSKFDVTRPQQ